MRPIPLSTMVTIALTIATVNATTFTVNTTDDGTDDAAGDGVCATALGTCTLRAAVTEANNHADPDRIMLPAGTYTLVIPPDPVFDNAHSGDLDVRHALEVRGEGADVTIVDGGGLDRVFHIANYPERVRFKMRGVTVQNGRPASSLGGGIEVYFGEVRLTDCVIAENEAVLGGGVDVIAGKLVLVNTTVRDNVGTNCCGGIRLLAGSSATLRRSTVRGNRAINNSTGGGITAFRGTGTLRISDSLIEDNAAAANGAGILFAGERGTIRRSTIRNNQADGSGGGISTFLRSPEGFAAGTLTLTDTDVTGNVADADGDGTGAGGGIDCDPDGPPAVLRRTTVTNNVDQSGRAPDCSGSVVNGGQSTIGDPLGCVVLP